MFRSQLQSTGNEDQRITITQQGKKLHINLNCYENMLVKLKMGNYFDAISDFCTSLYDNKYQILNLAKVRVGLQLTLSSTINCQKITHKYAIKNKQKSFIKDP